MTEKILTRMVEYEILVQIWDVLRLYYTAQNKAKVSQFKTQLGNIRKDALSISEYLLKVKNLVDLLGSIGYNISPQDHIEDHFYLNFKFLFHEYQ